MAKSAAHDYKSPYQKGSAKPMVRGVSLRQYTPTKALSYTMREMGDSRDDEAEVHGRSLEEACTAFVRDRYRFSNKVQQIRYVVIQGYRYVREVHPNGEVSIVPGLAMNGRGNKA